MGLDPGNKKNATQVRSLLERTRHEKTDTFAPSGHWEGGGEAEGVVVRSTRLC